MAPFDGSSSKRLPTGGEGGGGSGGSGGARGWLAQELQKSEHTLVRQVI